MQEDFKQPSTDECGYVPALLFVSSKESQHLNLEAVGWGQVLMSKWQCLGELTLMSTP